MDRETPSCDNAEEDYIDMEVSSTCFYYSKNSTSHPREFEFSNSIDTEPTTSPADELFYKGNLLPLHLPPRLQMVQKLLQNASSTTTTSTPFDSCINSPISSGRVSGELNSDEVFYECSAEESSFLQDQTCSKKLKLMKQSSFSLKLKASKAYLKSLFTKSEYSKENGGDGPMSKAKELLNKYIKMAKRNPFGQIQKEKIVEEYISHRRSFSLSMKVHSAAKSSSSSSSTLSSSSSSSSSANSDGIPEVHLLKRSSSANSDTESSIEGAIAYCKQSGQCGVWEKSCISSFHSLKFEPKKNDEMTGV